ncbi:AGAP005932-PA-like protein [Anopheles sinensis]|uniref:AGAP005932-PA-like protein n=1 Tax=Anopheles sinensis TaxID=74873 RepID=A0A084WA86_ANOSI|nr:AGAP005932-PA-like protein [Anopheles sinensis]
MSVQYGRRCFLCNNTRYRSKQCRLFRFPARGSVMWGKWLAALELTDADINVHSNEPPRLCQLHFDPKDFLQRQLSGMAVPVRSVKMHPTKVDADVRGNKMPIAGVGEPRTERQYGVPVEEGTRQAIVSGLTLGDCVVLSNGQDLVELKESNGCCSPTLGDTEEQLGDVPSITFRPSNCNIKQHETLIHELAIERARVKELLEENANQKHVIEEQRNLLLHLGVEYVAVEEGEDVT